MHIGRVGVWTFQLGFLDDAALRDAATELDDLGYGAIWFPGGATAFEFARKLLDASKRIVVATGIASIFQYDSATVASESAKLWGDFGERFVLGLGVSHPEAVNRGGGTRYSKPIGAMKQFLDELGDDVASRGVLAALRERMLTLARERTRGAHPYFVPVEHTARARQTLGQDALLAPEQAAVIETDPEVARRIARGHMQLYLQLQNYTNNLRSFGFTDDDIAGGGSDGLVDAIVAWGDAAVVAARVKAHHAAGADHVCVQMLEADFRTVPSEQWRALSRALAG